jgi:3-hydroxybutyryl-CoA dehydratase
MSLVFDQHNLEELTVGMEISYSQTISDADVKAFAGISGDNNPIHMSDEYAENSRFGKRIAHGLLSASFFSALFGTKIPGPGCVYVAQSLQFKRPVYLGDTVTATITIDNINLKKRRVFFRTVCYVKKHVVIDGKAELYIPKEK